MKNITAIVFLFIVSISTCFATQLTGIYKDGNPVQCNKFGWVIGTAYTLWENPCTPLEVKDGEQVYSIPTTEGRCQDNQIAVYQLDKRNKKIRFEYCYPIK